MTTRWLRSTAQVYVAKVGKERVSAILMHSRMEGNGAIWYVTTDPVLGKRIQPIEVKVDHGKSPKEPALTALKAEIKRAFKPRQVVFTKFDWR